MRQNLPHQAVLGFLKAQISRPEGGAGAAASGMPGEIVGMVPVASNQTLRNSSQSQHYQLFSQSDSFLDRHCYTTQRSEAHLPP